MQIKAKTKGLSRLIELCSGGNIRDDAQIDFRKDGTAKCIVFDPTMVVVGEVLMKGFIVDEDTTILFSDLNLLSKSIDIFGCICEGLSRTYASYAKF